MRLSPQAAEVIRRAASQHFGSQVRVWLFGSRVDDNARCGDIDLYLEVDFPLTDPVMRACRMNAQIQMALGEQKIDILVSDPARPRQRIHDIARQTGVRL